MIRQLARKFLVDKGKGIRYNKGIKGGPASRRLDPC